MQIPHRATAKTVNVDENLPGTQAGPKCRANIVVTELKVN